MIAKKFQVSYEKLTQAVQLLNEHDIDTWLVLTREGSDPSMPLLFNVRSTHKAAIFINRNGKHSVLTSVSDQGMYEETGLFTFVIPYYTSLEETFLQEYSRLAPKKMALNISKTDHLCDGLGLGLYLWLENLLGKERLQAIEVSSEVILKEIRGIKTDEEIKRLQKAIDITIEIYDEAIQQIRCGMTEIEIGQLFVEGMKKRGVCNGLGNAFDPPMVADVRNGLAHRGPANFKTEPGDIVIIDFSLKYEDYASDIARTLYMLKPGETKAPADIQKAFDTAIAAIDASIVGLEAGKKGFEVDALGRKVIEDAGYPTIRHSVGHQIGRETHDGGTVLGPQRPNQPRPEVEGVIKVGEVYAIEPTVIQDDGLPCILVEENVLVTAQGPQVMSKRQLELITIPCE